MVGAGIFALLGEATAIAGSAVYISFIIGGGIALLSGYSLGKLGARYPSAGGMVEYLSQSYGVGFFTGSMSIMLFFSSIVSLSLVAKAFGNYAVTFLSLNSQTPLFHHLFSSGIVVLFVLINLKGAGEMAVWERLIVSFKFLVLCAFSIAGIYYLKPNLLSPDLYPPTKDIFFSLAITFFAFEGFRVITNTAEDMPNPSKNLPKAITLSILFVMLLYVAISFAVFGNLPTDQVIASKDFALAQAALPLFGQAGFMVVAIAALVSTASVINASLYAVTNVTYQLARDGKLPKVFENPVGHTREGIIVSGLLIILLSLIFNLGEIAAVGSISTLFVHFMTHLGHFKLIKKTHASILLVLLAALTCLAAMTLSFIYVSQSSDKVALILGAFVIASCTAEITLQKLTKREIRPRIVEK